MEVNKHYMETYLIDGKHEKLNTNYKVIPRYFLVVVRYTQKLGCIDFLWMNNIENNVKSQILEKYRLY